MAFVTMSNRDPRQRSRSRIVVAAGGRQYSTPTTKPTPESSPALGGGETTTTTPLDDATVQANIDKALNADPALSGVDLSTLVENGKVTIVGSVRSFELKQRAERLIRSLKGV